MPTLCEVELRQEQRPALKLGLARLRRLCSAACAADGLGPALVGIIVVDAETSAALHREHFDVDGATDCMSFPDGSRDPETGRLRLGDIAICADVARRVGAERCGSTAAEAKETAAVTEGLLYAVHGVLHLLGLDDTDAAGRAEMWRRQTALLATEGLTVQRGRAVSADRASRGR